MAHSAELRGRVRAAYIEGLSLKNAASSHQVAYDTAREWKRSAKAAGDCWDAARTAYAISDDGVEAINQQMVESFARELVVTTRQLEAADNIAPVDKARLLGTLADSYAKFAKAFSRLNPEFSALSVALETLKLIAEHLKEADPKLLVSFQDHLEAVGHQLGAKYGR